MVENLGAKAGQNNRSVSRNGNIQQYKCGQSNQISSGRISFLQEGTGKTRLGRGMYK